ncbi:MAG TPA: dTDP-4-dehydrorhamnose 3,5-epimerase [Sphingomicrobium sp.]|jgi:dTDP-4-dehydrorhamnose 3,5-epimerase|nr:dTDP-4-dehydrorhamnose 3,5-epimerase [Sphingomicrobium sp.]
MLDVRETPLPGVLQIRPRRIEDERGFFSEVWNQAEWRKSGLDLAFVQENHSRSVRGVLRGLHYQLPPFAQTKLVRVSRGAVFDAVVDIRSSSASFGRWFGMHLSAREWNQLLVPEGFAHGFLALEPDTDVQYSVTAPYSAAHERAVRADDPAIGIEWPLTREEWILSPKDQAAPLLEQAELF